MTEYIDTSVLVRYMTGAPPEMAREAIRIIDSGRQVCVTDVVLSETAHVLTSFYQASREATTDFLIEFVRRQNITVYGIDKGIVIQALLLCRPSGRVSFPDALIWAAARETAPSAVYTFDRRFPPDGIDVRRTAD